jgi:hypothetical protein
MKRKYPTMMNRLNAVSETLSSALSEIKSIAHDLTSIANAKKASLLALLTELGETRNMLDGLSKLCSDTGASLLDIDEACDTIVCNIDDTFDSLEYLPEGSYETFVGFCYDCGVELHQDDDFEPVDALDIRCAECAAKSADDEDEADTEEDTDNV